MKALLVMGPQCDFLKGGKTPIKGSDKVLLAINKLIKASHMAIPIFYIKDGHAPNHCNFKLEKEHCLYSAPGARFPKELEIVWGRTYILDKGMDRTEPSHSTFYATDGLMLFEEFLGREEVTELVLVGWTLEGDIKDTCIDARARDYVVTVPKSLVLCRDKKNEKETMDYLKGIGVKFTK